VAISVATGPSEFAGQRYLPFDCVAYIFDSFANFPSSFTKTFFNLTTGMLSPAFVFQLTVVGDSANGFLGLAFNLIEFAFNLVFVW
jgi:hypothetical protein